MHRKINIFLFILGALLSIFGGVFDTPATLTSPNTLLLVLLGFLIGLLNIEDEEEAGFLLAALVFIMSVSFINPILKDFPVLVNIAAILFNFAILTATATAVVSLRWVLSYTSTVSPDSEEEKREEKEHKVPLEKYERIWAVVMLIAVSIVLIEVILESFFNVAEYQSILNIVDYIILLVFIADLTIIYLEVKDFKRFIKMGWLDILATIPFNLFAGNAGFLRALKLVRILRIVKLQKVTKVARVNRALKFFSHKSKFNKYVHEKKE